MQLTSKRTSILDAFAIFCVGVILFTLGSSHQEIIGFESRFYLFALEMWRQGVSWFPTTYLQPYPDYPVTSILFIHFFAHLFGGLTKFTAIFPSACAAAITFAVTYLVGALHDRRWGYYASALLLFTLGFIAEARTISLDQYTTAVTVLCFYLVHSAAILHKTKRLGWIVPLFILGFACRGPIGLIIPASVVGVYYLLDKKWKCFFTVSFLAVSLLFICSLVLLSMAYHVGGMHFVQDVLRMQVTSRVQDANTLPMYFYFVDSLGSYALSYPLALLVLLGIAPTLFKTNGSADLKFLQKLAGWVFIILIGLSLPADKKVRYILSLTPALALISAYVFVAAQEQKYLWLLRTIVYWICCFFPLISLGCAAWVFYKGYLPLSLGLIFILLLLQLGLFLLNYFRYEILVVGIAALVFVMSYIHIVEAINVNLNRTSDFVLQVENLRQQSKMQLVFYHENADGLPIKYLVHAKQYEPPIFIATIQELLQYDEPAIFVTGAENFAKIPETDLKLFRIISQGKIGHDPVVVFTLAQ